MVNPFTSFAFPASGSGVNTNITLPTRLAYIKNVKDFGAKGDGVTDDWAAITAAFNWTTGDNTNRGTIYFPPGTYLVSNPIDFSGVNVNAYFVGVGSASIITGNFADYVLKRTRNDPSGESGGHVIENLQIINSNAAGGGIRIGASVGAAVRNCIVTANKGINTASNDTGTNIVSEEVSIENCILNGSNTANSEGILTVSDGVILGCTIINYATGYRVWGQQPGSNVLGCHFETCGVAMAPGTLPGGTAGTYGGLVIAGCSFKNCSTAIQNLGGFARVSGVTITGTNGAAPGSANPQYGINISTNGAGGIIEGVSVSGQFDIAGIAIAGGEAFSALLTLIGVQVTNTSTTPGAVAWSMPSTSWTAQFIGCNVAPVYTVANLPLFTMAVTAASWSSGTATLTISVPNPPGTLALGGTWNVIVSGITPSGYNGTFTGVTAPAFNQLSYSVANPGGNGTIFGSVVVVAVNSGTEVGNSQEGDCYNVSDGTNSLAWGATVTNTGTHTTHYKVRYNGSNFAVVGQ